MLKMKLKQQSIQILMVIKIPIIHSLVVMVEKLAEISLMIKRIEK